MDKKLIKREISLRFTAICQYLMFKYHIDSDMQMSRKLNVHPQIISDIKVGKLQVGIDLISILLDTFSNINLEWMFTGKGDMILYHTRKQKEALDKFYTAIKNDPQLDKQSIKNILASIFDDPYSNDISDIDIKKDIVSNIESNKLLIEEVKKLTIENHELLKENNTLKLKKETKSIGRYDVAAEP